MTISDIMFFFDLETTVVVYTSDGEKYTGVITGVENDFETDSGIDEIELYSGGSYSLSIEIPDIKKIEKAQQAR